MRFEQAFRTRGKALLFAALATLSLAAPASPIVLGSLTQAERDADRNGVLDPLAFTFSGLDAPVATADRLFLTVDFSFLDLGQRTEVLGVNVKTGDNTIYLGMLDQTITGGNLASNNANGYGEFEILLSAIGGLKGGTLDLLLTTNSRIQAYHTGGTSRCYLNCEGSATATLSYEPAPITHAAASPQEFQEEPDSVPLPGTLALIGVGVMGAGFARRRRSARESATAS